MCDAIDDAGDPARRLAPITVAAAHVLVDACESASLGDWERVELDGEHLAKVAEGPNGSPSGARDELDQGWDTIGVAIARWRGEAHRPGVEYRR
jgi:hypothetical protein